MKEWADSKLSAFVNLNAKFTNAQIVLIDPLWAH